MNNIIAITQIAISCLLVISILLQEGESALGSSFGSGQGFYGTKRGIQKKIFISTIIFGFLFVFLALLNIILS